MTESFAVCVAGAGPVGLNAGLQLQRNGFDTVVLEDGPEVGKPCQCTGLISRRGYEELGLTYDEVILNRVRGADIFAPDGTKFHVERPETVAYVIDRVAFDKRFLEDYQRAGGSLRLNTKFMDVNNETVFTKENGHGGMLKAKIVVGADGILSQVRKCMGIEVPKEHFVPGYQLTVSGSFDKDFVEVHLCSEAEKFFAWLVPENSRRARIGIGSYGGNAREALEKFIARRGLSTEKSCDVVGGVIPAGPPLPSLVKGNMLLAGDAAFQAKATTGGGIMLGIEAANYAADSVVEWFKRRKPLKGYEEKARGIRRELEVHWRVRKYFNALTETELNKLFARLKDAGVESFLSRHGEMDKPRAFLQKMLTTPKLWGLAPEVLRFLRG